MTMPPPIIPRSLLLKWLILIAIVVALPLTLTYSHVYLFLRSKGTITKRFERPYESGIYFFHDTFPPVVYVPTNDLFAPSIVQLVARLQQEPPITAFVDLDPGQEKPLPIQTLDYSKPFLSLDSILPAFLYNSSPESQLQKRPTRDDEVTTTTNQFGFRANRSKQQNNNNKNDAVTPLPPLATYFWIALNVGLFVLYKIQNVDSSTVALNGHIFHDYGRAITGNLAHFEIWHVGFNMMSAWTLGPTLENPAVAAGAVGTIPLFLYTASFLATNTLVVLGLHHLRTKYCHTTTTQTSSSSVSNPISFPSMVGFSGILFAWSVVATLQTRMQTCPIPILPNLCFDTYRIAGGRLTVSLGPLVQLMFLQLVLPRASFLGHLAGIVVGFMWHWNVLPPLEYLQPCILYPTVWGLGKWYNYYCYHQYRVRCIGGTDVDGHRDNAVSHSPWTTGSNNTLEWSTFRSSTLYSLLKLARNATMVHLAMIVFLFHANSGSSSRNAIWTILNSVVLSQALLIAILTVMIQRTDERRLVGMIGRGLVVMVLVTGITDAMTLGGWLATRILWNEQPYWNLLLVLWLMRFLLWALILCLTCHTLSVANELIGDPERPPSNDIWTHLLAWTVVDACRPVGKMLADHGSTPARHSRGRTIGVSTRHTSVLLSSVSRGETAEAHKTTAPPTKMIEESSARVVSDII